MQFLSVYNKNAQKMLDQMEEIVKKVREKYPEVTQASHSNRDLAIVFMQTFLPRTITPVLWNETYLDQPELKTRNRDQYVNWAKVNDKNFKIYGTLDGKGFVEYTPLQFVRSMPMDATFGRLSDTTENSYLSPVIQSAHLIQINEYIRNHGDYPNENVDLIREYVGTLPQQKQAVDMFMKAVKEFDDVTIPSDDTLLTLRLQMLVPGFRHALLFTQKNHIPVAFFDSKDENDNEKAHVFFDNLNSKNYLIEEFTDHYEVANCEEMMKDFEEDGVFSSNSDTVMLIESPVIPKVSPENATFMNLKPTNWRGKEDKKKKDQRILFEYFVWR